MLIVKEKAMTQSRYGNKYKTALYLALLVAATFIMTILKNGD